MQINQHNYEEFFLLYVDNELSVQEKEMVEAFVKQNPHLAGELELLKQTVLDIDESVDFDGKEKLIKRPELTEEDLLVYLDGEAGKELAGKVEQGMQSNDTLKLELENLGQLYFKADLSIQYPSKEKLYKRGAVRSMDWRKLAIAASLLLCVSTWLVLNQSEQEESNDAPVAVNTPFVGQPARPAPAVADTNNRREAVAIPEQPIYSDDKERSIEKRRKSSGRTDQPVVEQVAVSKSVTGSSEVARTTTVVEENSNKENQPTQLPELPKNAGETIKKSPSAEPLTTVASVKEPGKEKKSLFKKIGKQISDRALDILSDGSDNINVAGFAIRVEK
ncbi:MAG TPA: hypothetical protein VL943_01985 [Niabella sp.]|nr:hypothetical protein [Niabella sp.]